MYGYPAMEMNEAFVKIREQSKAYLDRPLELGVSDTSPSSPSIKLSGC
jgi:hypothetical protein